ncbi:MAG: RnfABCDGE type electron transport complex subunit B [Thermodesulfobacteriota bacterium]
MVEALFLMGGLGLVIGCGLAVASKVFYVYVDPKILEVESALPGANCGGCGMPGCSANAEAIVAGKSSPGSCVAAGPEVSEAIAKIMGVSLEAKEPDIAKPGCTYGVDEADLKFNYEGLKDCRAVALLGGGMKVCRIGCLGLGTCARACPFNAIAMGPQGLPVVDAKRCTGCGTCERVCPKHIINMSSVTRRILREYTTEECTTPCQRACPAGIDIREYILQISRGDYERSVQVIKERNPFPTVIGRICPRPCETDCRRKYVDEPVAINCLKRYVADVEKEKGERILPYKAPSTGRKIAVIGGGAEGLSTAFFSARLGHVPTVFEATSNTGGLLRTAIAAYRLPSEILDWDIEGIKEMGVEIKTGTPLGGKVSMASLFREGFQAIFLASGGWDSRLTRGKDADREEPVPGMILLIDFLKNRSSDRMQQACRGNVVIAGGGALALDAALACKKGGAKDVTIVLREPMENPVFRRSHINQAQKEGIRLLFDSGIRRIIGEGEHLTSVESVCISEETVEDLPAQTLIIASGRFPELILTQSINDHEGSGEFRIPNSELPVKWEGIPPYKNPEHYGRIGILAKGDELSDFSAMIKAIGAGRRAAASIHQMMYSILPSLPDRVLTPDSDIQNLFSLSGVTLKTRQIMPLSSSGELEKGIEIEKGFTRDMAQAEADRCLQCGLICYKRSEDEPKEGSAAGE